MLSTGCNNLGVIKQVMAPGKAKETSHFIYDSKTKSEYFLLKLMKIKVLM